MHRICLRNDQEDYSFISYDVDSFVPVCGNHATSVLKLQNSQTYCANNTCSKDELR